MKTRSEQQSKGQIRVMAALRLAVYVGLALSCATVWGFLDNFGLVGHADGYWMVIAWFFGLGLGGIVNKLTLGAGGS